MAAIVGHENATPVLESTETDEATKVKEEAGPPVMDDQWRAMKTITETIVSYRDDDDHDPSKIFHKKVNKRILPDYYEVIKEPIAISTIKQKADKREYATFAEYVRDWALLVHNAQTYNRPDAGAYIDALTIRDLVEGEFEKLIAKDIITASVAAFPDLGEIPPVEALPIEEEEDDDDEDDDEDEDDEADDSDEEGAKKKRKRGRPSNASALKREGTSKDDGQKASEAAKKKRGRPPKVDTPMEARIKNVLKAIRKPKNDQGQIMIHHFEKLPDKATMPEYFVEIKDPIAIELIKRKQKRKKYHSVDHFMRDVDTMFNNAKSYNQDESQIYKDAVYLQAEAHRLAEIEKARPDSDFVMEEGRIPMPNGILHNNELWQIGDWVHIQNANDVTKSIVAQIYRTWQDTEGQHWINACWYYRPEQTVHQYEKHFFPDEVVKTGQYRDHHVDEIINRCFVMFFTRYSRGRPKGIPADRDVYVCEARYNEEKHKLNKIKTWASCLPDQVRENDYEMDLFEGIRKVKKVPSPLLHMLKEDAKETDELPKPRWGAENAPPIVGGIYKGPRDENQSPPPEPTPTPPPQPPPTVRQVLNISNHDSSDYRRNSDMNSTMQDVGRSYGASSTPTHPTHSQPSYPLQHPTQQYHQHSVSPAPIQYHQHGQQNTAFTPHTPASAFAPPTQTSHVDHYSSPQARTNRMSYMPGANPMAKPPDEVFHLSDSANAAIPADIRAQFQTDEHGRVLFFTKPPLDVLPPVDPPVHSLKYVAAKLRRQKAEREKLEATMKLPIQEQMRISQENHNKRIKLEEEEEAAKTVQALEDNSMLAMAKWLDEGTDVIYKREWGSLWQEAKELDRINLIKVQAEEQELQRKLAESSRKRKLKECIPINSKGPFLDDFDPRY
ncbi:hypothetical protein MMC30_003771 [Trapelia coarctata]|nr:hypothetical protein [Trapelia coarctata]